MEPFIGQIQPFPYNFAPRGWAFCQGQLLSISTNTALFSLLGTTFGGNGQTTFALPDLRGRTMVGVGQGPGLSNYELGQVGGTEMVTMTASQMPVHSHGATATSTLYGLRSAGTSSNPTGNVMGASADMYVAPNPSARVALDASSIATTAATENAGGSQPVSVVSPYLGINICIALEGIFPSRN